MGEYVEANILCPYYIQRFKTQRLYGLKCEGLVPKSTNIMLFGTTEINRTMHSLKYCCGDYMECPLAKALEEKYDKRDRQNTSNKHKADTDKLDRSRHQGSNQSRA